MNLSNFIISVVTSASVSSLIIIIFRSYINKIIEHHFRKNLEEYKSELAIKTDIESSISQRRLEAYPKIVELVYRTHNIVRDLINSKYQKDSSLIAELEGRKKELEDYLFQFRIELERDELFKDVHIYKNNLINFCILMSDVHYYSKQKKEQKAAHRKEELITQYKIIENSYQQIITLFPKNYG